MARLGMLLFLIALSAATRLGFPHTPQGIHPDEASNIWNAWCIGNTLADEHAVTLPIFYTGAFNDNRSALFLYVLAPFEMVFGLSSTVARLPAAVSGVISTVLLFSIVRKIAADRIAFMAALLWALDPTHLQQTRGAHEASITPMLVLASIWCWQKTFVRSVGILDTPQDTPTSRYSMVWPILAGLVSGVSCYAYASVRIYLPLLLLAAALLNWKRFDRNNRRIALFGIIAFAALFTPLLYVHMTDPAINERARATWTWAPSDSLATAAVKVAARYVEHFDPHFLFVHGTTNLSLAPPRPFGALPWIWLPLIAIGLGAAWRRRTEPLARFVLLALLVYPLGDVLNAAGGPNVLRCLCGWFCFSILSALGVDAIVSKGAKLSRRLAPVAVGLTIAATLPNAIAVIVGLGNDPMLQRIRGVDFQQACEFASARQDDYDAIVFTATDAAYAYPGVLIDLKYSAEQFLTEPSMRAIVKDHAGASPDVLVQTGKIFFLHPVDELMPAIRSAELAGQRGRSLWVLRPTDAMASPTDRVLQTISLGDGQPSLLIVEHRRQNAP